MATGAAALLSVPDGTEVVATRAEADKLASPPLLILDAVTAFLDEHNLGSGPLSWAQIGDGQSNVTYRIQRGSDVFVLRRGPRPPLPPSTHDMVREARIQQLLKSRGVPVPEILAVCGDESILGVPFYVMSYLDGLVITNTIPAALDSAEQRLATSNAVVDTLVKLHSVDVAEGDLASFGRPDGYLRRQVERFSALWDINTTRSLPDVGLLGGWLADNLPDSQQAAVLHGDYRPGNLMFHRSAPARVAAVLDWEMAAVGDPLADLGYLTATIRRKPVYRLMPFPGTRRWPFGRRRFSARPSTPAGSRENGPMTHNLPRPWRPVFRSCSRRLAFSPGCPLPPWTKAAVDRAVD
jgi:aminoglycoside phosphotransferase (APT) family kinase protein